ncbi:ATP-binding cassette domain-containing protein [Motilimonas sp. E26]|uniref:ATP-binding cassette domain-containing protein n=1 Tax=Motilimonas sp. E26 TaxID=2865674 RepID=UPI001E42B765|nr:ATP-binding cassette domain-containing protein [Motilimonas sp. E26]MCE0558286.1 ATP-binding cassette domain-containing protein [Motilimonas sp. E26]
MRFCCEQFSITLEGKVLFAPLNFNVQGGEQVCIMGPSGSGKSTLLSAIAGTIEPIFRCHGDLRLNNNSLIGQNLANRKVGMMFQEDLLFPHLNVAQNLTFALPQGLSTDQRREKINQALIAADMAGFNTRDVATLSGGQRSRISLLRTLLAEPKLLLLDEPFAKLDKPLRQNFRQFVLSHIQAAQIPAILVSHDLSDAEDCQVVELCIP